MTTISDDPPLPLDPETASRLFSNSLGEFDSEYDNQSSDYSGMKPGATGVGKASPPRIRTVRDQEEELGELRKENFGLKLRIYHLEEALHKKNDTKDKGWQMNVELNVQMESMKKQLLEKDRVLVQAKTAMDQYEDKLQGYEEELSKRPETNREVAALKDQLKDLERKLADREDMLQEAQAAAEEALNRLTQEEAKNRRLQQELERQEAELLGKIGDLERQLEQKVVPEPPVVRAKGCQTDEDPLANELAEAAAARDKLARRGAKLEEELSEAKKKVQSLEMKLLDLTQRMAEMEGNHVQRMREKQEELDRCKRELYEMEDRLRRKEAELEDMTHKRDSECQRVRELETQLRQLRDLLHEKDREIRNLQDRIDELERERGSGRDKDKELQDLRRKYLDAKARAKELEAAVGAKDREIKRLTEELADREEEVRSLRAKIRSLEEALNELEVQLHQAELERNKHASILDQMQRELENLRQQLKRYQDGIQLDQDGALAAKDATIAQLQKEIAALRAKLAEAERKYQLLSNSSAADIGALRAEVEALSRQIEELQRALRDREEELARGSGDKRGLQREVDRLREENHKLREEAATLRLEIAKQAKGMEQAELDIEELRRLLESMKEQQAAASELAALRDRVASLEHALQFKDRELTSLVKTLAVRDQTILDLEQELRRLKQEKRDAETRAGLLEKQNARLEEELSLLRAKYGSTDLSLVELQNRLDQALAERDSLNRKLKVTEELLNQKEKAFRDMENMYRQLNDELLRMQQQLNDLQGGSPARRVHIIRETTVDDSPNKAKSSNTFGHLSEDILLMILQRLQELQGDISAGRADASVASSSLATKLEILRQQLRDSLRESRQDSNDVDGEKSRSTPNLSASFTREWRQQAESSPRAELRSLQSRLEEALRWNEALQARLDESRRNRDSSVGGESDRGRGMGAAGMDKYLELTKEVDRLLEELAAEREKSKQEKSRQEDETKKVRDVLRRTERNVLELKEQLRTAMTQREASNSVDLGDIERLERELGEARSTVTHVTLQFDTSQAKLEEVRRQLDRAHDMIAELRAQLDFERRENKRLKDELANTSSSSANDSLGASSLPNLLSSPRGDSSKNKSDSWTTPPPRRRGKKPDISALKAKNEDMSRLNTELQRKCEEQLLKTSSSSSSLSQSAERSVHMQTHVHTEHKGEASQSERERDLVAQVRKAEGLLQEKEEEWLEKEERLKAHLEEAQRALAVARSNMEEEMKVTVKAKDEQILNLSKSLRKARDQVGELEQHMAVLTSEKDETIQGLKAELRGCKRELESALLRLSSSQELVYQLQKEMSIFQRLVEELRQASSSRGAGGGGNKSLEELIGKLLQELDVSIRSNSALAEQLRSRLSQDSTLNASGDDVDTSFHSYVITTDGERGAGHKERSASSRKSVRNASTYVSHTTVTSKPAASSSPKSSPRMSHAHNGNHRDGGSQCNLESSSSSSSFSAHGVNSTSRRSQATQQSHFASLALHGFGDYETLESRLKRALDSSSLQDADRAFLEELLLYLRQQQKQLDDNRRLLERLEREQQHGDEAGLHNGIPASAHIPSSFSESGTIPAGVSYVPPASRHVGTSFSSRRSHVATRTAGLQVTPPRSLSPRTVPGRMGVANTSRPSSSDYGRRGATPNGSQSRTARTKIDLGPLYEQLMQSQASLMEAKTSLLQSSRHSHHT